jgi:NADH-quinone oxidoreductase subunit A
LTVLDSVLSTGLDCAAFRGRSESKHNPVLPGALDEGGMLENYLPVLMFLAVGVGFGLLLIILGFLFGPRKPDSEKLAPYECGFEAFEDTRMRFDVRYYLVAILFIIFDLETAFLFPWAVVLEEIGMFAYLAMMLFLGILVIGFIYEWKKGALEWE